MWKPIYSTHNACTTTQNRIEHPLVRGLCIIVTEKLEVRMLDIKYILLCFFLHRGWWEKVLLCMNVLTMIVTTVDS